MTGERVLVTGGAGLIGSYLARSLVADGADVVVADDLSRGRRDRVPDGATLVETDLTSADGVARAVTDDLDRVYHLAADPAVNADDRRAQVEANTQMTYDLLGCGRGRLARLHVLLDRLRRGTPPDARGLRTARTDQRVRRRKTR